MARVKEIGTPWPSASGRRKEKHDGRMCDVQAKRSTSRELDQMPPLGRVRNFPLALFWEIPADRE
jgi:hypothetical protein